METLRLLKRQKKTHYLTDGYEVVLEPATVKTGKLIERFPPRQIPYDSIIVQRPGGYISFAGRRGSFYGSLHP